MEEKYTGIDLGLENGDIVSIPKEKIKECEIHIDFKNNILFNAKIRFVMSPEFSTFFRNYYSVADSWEDKYERGRFIDYLMHSDRLNVVDITIKHKDRIDTIITVPYLDLEGLGESNYDNDNLFERVTRFENGETLIEINEEYRKENT